MSDKKTSFFKKILNFYNRLYSESYSETKNTKFLFLFFTGIFFGLFFFITGLSGKNPYQFLVPFTLFDFDLPLIDKRSEYTIYLSDGKKNVFPSKRKLILDKEDVRKRIYSLITEVSEPPFYASSEDISRKDENINYKKLPNIHFTVISIWIKDSTLILDLRESTLHKELESIKVRVDKSIYQQTEQSKESGKLALEFEEVEREKKARAIARMEMLDSAFLTLEKTLFENLPDIQNIEYRLDGKRKDFPNLEYKLKDIHKR